MKKSEGPEHKRGEILTSGKTSLKIHSRSSAQAFSYGVGFKACQSSQLQWKPSQAFMLSLGERGENQPHRPQGRLNEHLYRKFWAQWGPREHATDVSSAIKSVPCGNGSSCSADGPSMARGARGWHPLCREAADTYPDALATEL